MNPNLFIWTSDWHVGRITDSNAAAMTTHINGLEPAGVIDTGDCKDSYGANTGGELDRYITNVLDQMPWAQSVGAPHPVLPGNHDEINDYTAAGSDFSLFDSHLWPASYHWTADWAAPKVRFIAFHARIVHMNDSVQYAGFFTTEPAERQWLSDQLDALPTGWQVVICSHPPLDPAFGNNIGHWSWLTHGGTEIRQILQAHAPRVTAYLNGHRHDNMRTNVLDGVTHFNGPGVAYTLGNGYGGFVPIDYDPAARTLTFRYHLARAPFAAYSGYTPVVIQLPSITEPPADTLPLTKLSETATTLTLGWTPVAGVGYRFSAEQQPSPSHTWDATRSSVEFAKGSSWYKVEALQVGVEGDYP